MKEDSKVGNGRITEELGGPTSDRQSSTTMAAFDLQAITSY